MHTYQVSTPSNSIAMGSKIINDDFDVVRHKYFGKYPVFVFEFVFLASLLVMEILYNQKFKNNVMHA